jgi:hypothetical protein
VYDEYHKSPRTAKAGPGFANPDFELPVEWLETRRRIQEAEREQKDASRRSRVLLVSALDEDSNLQQEVRSTAKALVEAVTLSRAGKFPDVEVADPRPK